LFSLIATEVHNIDTATSRVENPANVLSCEMKFVHAGRVEYLESLLPILTNIGLAREY
jgi:hypothetical protein